MSAEEANATGAPLIWSGSVSEIQA